MGVTFTGCGAAAPKTVVLNDALAQVVDTSDEWISSRTGIRQRHISNDRESLASLATQSALQALEMAGVDAADVDLILLGSLRRDGSLFGICIWSSDSGSISADGCLSECAGNRC